MNAMFSGILPVVLCVLTFFGGPVLNSKR